MRAVIFDIDDTLLHSASGDDRIYRRAVGEVLGDVQQRPDLHDYPHVSDTGILLQIFADNGIPSNDERFASVKERFLLLLRQYIDTEGPFTPLPGALDFIARLTVQEDVGVAIATGGWRDSARMKLEAAGFDTRDLPLASSDDAMERTSILQHALDSLPGRYENIVYYGDGEWDRRAVRELGWTFRPVGPALNGIRSFDAER